MKKVLFTATVDSHILQFHLPFLKYFKERGYEVHVATNGNKEIPYCDVKHFVSFERSPLKLNNIKAINILKKICLKEKFDIIHTHTPMGSVVTRLAAASSRKKFNTRVIYTAHGFHFFKGAPLKNWIIFYSVEKYLAKFTDTLILINQEDYDLAKKKFLKRCHDIQYVPGVGIDKEKFDFEFSSNDKKALRKSLGLNEKDFIMIYPAELSKRKRQIWLINSLSDFMKKHDNIHLLLPGKDSLNGECQKIVEKNCLSNQIHFLGYRKDIPQLLKISNLALSSARQEGLPVNIMEAMYVGLPIVGTDCRGNRDLIKNNINGYLIDLNDNVRFANCVEKIYLKKNNDFSNNSKQIIEKYMLNVVLAKMTKIYEKKKRVLHILASNIFSGAENIACTIIKNLSSDYEMAYCSPKGSIENILKEKGIPYYSIDKLSLKNIKNVINDFKPDIIHAHDFKATFYACFFNKKCKIISHIHKNDPQMKKKSLKSVIYLFCTKKIKTIFGVSDSIINEYIYKDKIKDKFVTLYNYIDKDNVIKLSDEYKINKKYDLFYIGRLNEEKNPAEFIEVVNKLNDSKVKCVMIGDGPLKSNCEQLIKKYKLEKNIDMVGFKSNPFPYIKNSNIGIMPSKYEGFGITAVESLILNKPVLNSGVGGLKIIFCNNPEYICNSVDDYTNKIKNINKYKFKDVDISNYTDLSKWKKIIEEEYGGE